MPIWFELIVLLLAAYGVGMGIGWLIWSRQISQNDDIEGRDEE